MITKKQQQKKNKMVPTESEEQIAVISYASYMANRDPRYGLLYHIPNGGERSKAEAGRFRAEGVKSGVPDLCLPVAKGGYHGLYIELKRIKGGRISPAQTEWLASLNDEGYLALVAYGAEQAIKILDTYMEGRYVKTDDL